MTLGGKMTMHKLVGCRPICDKLGGCLVSNQGCVQASDVRSWRNGSTIIVQDELSVVLTPQFLQSKCDLNVDIISSIDEWDSREKPLNNGRISSQWCQYVRKAFEVQWPWIMTIGSTPRRSR